jgi:hypothetical protein
VLILSFCLILEFIINVLSALDNGYTLTMEKDILACIEMTGLSYYFYDIASCKIDRELILDPSGSIIFIKMGG